jgi:hypothetical protein
MAMFAQSIKEAKRPRAVDTLDMKLKIIADNEAGKQEVIRNVEADLCCYKEVLTEMWKLIFAATRKSSLKCGS